MVRHGATLWNASRRFQGATDVALSEQGRRQAEAIAGRLAVEGVECVYSSDLSRALDTARAVARAHGLEVVADARLREFSFGAWEGLTWDEIVATDERLRDAAPTAAKHYTPAGGETFAGVTERVGAFFEAVRIGPHRRVVAVTHAGPLHAALAALKLDGEALGVSFSPGGITRIAMTDDGARLISLNDVRHLHTAG